MLGKEIKCGDISYKVSCAPLRYLTEVIDYSSAEKIVPYELKLMTICSSVSFKEKEGDAWQKITEEKLNLFCSGTPHLFKLLFDLVFKESITDDQKKIEEFIEFAKRASEQ